jgi:PKHD-type hydroxylase
MKGEWCYFQNVFSPEECNYIISEGQKIPGKNATLGVEGSLTDNNYRKSEVRFFRHDNPTFDFVFQRLWNHIIPANREWFQVNINRLDFIQLAEYNSSYKGFYARHHDVFWMNDDPVFHRKLSCIVQLTDDTTYEGGDFELFNVKFQPPAHEIRKQGTVFFFPSFVEHQANPVTSGVRHSLAAWFEGPKWQ